MSKKKKTGNGSYQIATVPDFFIGAKIELLRSRTPILREKVFCIAYVSFVSVMPCKSRLILPLLRNKGAPFPHALRCLSAGNTRFRQSGQYLTLLEVDAKETPHSVQRFLSSVLKSSAYSSLSRGSTAV